MGGGGGGKGGGGSTVQQVQIPPEVLARYNAVNARAEQVAATPFQPYTGEFVAPLNQTQLSGINATSQASQMAQPYYGAATQATLGGMQNVGPLTQQQIGYYQNPYTQAVVDPTLAALRQQQGQQLSEQQSQAIKSGAFGGDRSGIARATLQGQQNLALGQAIAPLYQQGYNTAVQTAMGQQGVVAADLARQLTGGQQLGNLGSAAQQAALSGAQAQIAAGTLPQQTQQAEDTAKYQQFMQEKGYPFQTTQFLANIAEGTGALSGNTTTQTQGGGFFSSDARLKENIEPIGELFDGQTVYRYNYKDDKHKKTQIGLIAQEAAKEKKPGVGVDNDGYLAVNYHDATDEAADAGKGLVPSSMGGAVREAGAFARGGYATDGGVDFGSLVAAHAKLYDEGKKKEAGLGIPTQGSAPKSLQVQPMLKPDKQPNAMEQAMKMGQGVAQTGEAIKKISNWHPLDALKEKTGIGLPDKNTTRVPGAENPNAKGLPGAASPAATAAPTKTTGLVPSGDKLTTPTSNQLALGPDLGPNAESFNRPAPTSVAPQRYADSGQTMNDAGRQPYLPDANNNVDVAYSGQAYELPQTAAQPPLQGIQAQNAAFENADGGSGLDTAANESFANAGNDGMDFASSLENLGDFAGYGSDMADMVDVADVGDIGSSLGDVMAFVKRGGRIGHYANGGLIPRQHYAGKGFVTPGYDTEHDPNDIMDTTVEEGEQSPNQLQSEQKAINPPMHSSGGGGGGGGFNPMSAIGPAISLFSMFSDARLKKNIEPVGKTYDGQNIYRYDFGDGNTQLGLIAQEVAKHTPHAVHKKDGYLTVDYKHATEAAAPRHAYADGGGSRFVTDDERLQQLLSAGQKAPSEAPVRYRMDNGAELRGSTMLSGPFTEYGAGLGVDLGGGRLNMDAARGSAPGSQPQYRGKLGWSKNFASGGLVPREHHDGTEGNVVGPSDQDLDYMARTMIREAGGEGPEGMAAVGHVMRNRLNSGNFGKTMENVATAPKQFTPWNEDLRGTYQDPRLINPESEDYKNARELARKVHLGEIEDPTKGALNFYNPKKASPSWGETMGNRITIGNHDFGTAGGAPRPPKDVGPAREEAAPERGLGSFLSGKSGKGEFDKTPAKFAGLGDVVREYGPSGMPTSENFWMPALGFLGGMLASPNPKFLGALGSGLVSGVSTQFELDKLNEDRVKNAFNMLKDRFEDAVGYDKNNNPIPMKRDRDTGTMYGLEQMGAIRGKLLESMGVNAAAYGAMLGQNASAKGDKAGVLPAPSGAATTAPAASAAVAPPAGAGAGEGSIKPVEQDPLVKAASEVGVTIPGKPPEDFAKENMTLAQLKARAFWNWKEEGLSEDPRGILANIVKARKEAQVLAGMGVSNAPRAAQLEGIAKSENERLQGMLKDAAERQDSINKENDKLKGASASKYGNEVAARIEAYDARRHQVEELNRVYAEFKSGRSSEALAKVQSILASAGIPINSKYAGDFDYAMKLAMTQVVEDVATDKLMRAPASGMKTLIQTVPAPSLDPGATYTLLGRLLGEMDYVHRRDLAYKEGTSPLTFAKDYHKTNNRSINQDVAAGLNQLRFHKDMSPDIIKSLYEKYGQHGFDPKGIKDVSAPAAASPQNAQALEWANDPKNANDPRAKQIKQRLGVQ